MDPEDLEMLKKKHRAKELRKITEADMEYLKALFNELEKEKQDNQNGVSLELAGIEVSPFPGCPLLRLLQSPDFPYGYLRRFPCKGISEGVHIIPAIKKRRL